MNKGRVKYTDVSDHSFCKNDVISVPTNLKKYFNPIIILSVFFGVCNENWYPEGKT
jgi:hypothetical protein